MRQILAILVTAAILWSLSGCKAAAAEKVQEIEATTFGIDVARYQGTIDWQQVADSGIDFAMVRLGYRSMVDGEIVEDVNARYNLQEANNH